MSDKPQIENKIRAALHAPDPDPAFVNDLRRQLMNHATRSRRAAWARPAWRLALAALTLLVIGAALASPPIVTAVRRWFGYVPEVGLVEQSAALRVLAETSALTRDSITVTVTQVVLDSEKTVILYHVEGIPPAAYPKSEDAPFCAASPQLRLPSGAVLNITGGGGRQDNFRLTFAALPADVNEATFELPCLMDTAPGAAPENWQLPLRFVPAPPEMNLTPVLDVPTATPASASPVAPTAAPLFGIQLTLDQVIPLDDGYYLVGHTAWNDARITAVGIHSLKAQDASGNDAPLEEAYFGDLGIDQPEPTQWVYKLYGQVFNSALTLRMERVRLALREPITFTFTPGLTPQLGQVWNLNEPLTVLDYNARVVSATYMKQGDLRGFEFGLQAEPVLYSLDLWIAEGIANGNAGGGGSTGDGNGRITSYLLSNGEIVGPLKVVSTGAVVNGAWELTWTPPVVNPSFTPTPIPQACLTLDKWKQALAKPAPVPQGLSGKIIVYGRIQDDGQPPSPDNYGIFVANLDGSKKEVLGPGVWPALSPDGSQAAYAAEDGLHTVDLATGADHLIPNTASNDYHPLWSPDGASIAFVRVEDKNLYTIHPDGTGLRRVTTDVDYEQLVAWSPDGTRLYYTIPRGGEQLLRSVNLASGEVSTSALDIGGKGVSASLSADGAWLAYVDKVPGKVGGGVYVVRTDGTDQRLIIQLEHWSIHDLVWSPEGQWLLVGILDTDQFVAHPTAALVNVATCQTIPLTTIEGDVQGWSR
jgi:hypothetical protein